MTIEQLGYFLRLAEELNYTAVANSFFITQPTLSRQIFNLERELRVTLFIREHNGVRLTPEGQVFYQKLKPIFLDLMKLLQETQEQKQSKEELMIGIQAEQLMSNALTLAISKIRHIYPQLKINIHRCTVEELTEALEKGKYDIINMLQMPTVGMQMPTDFIELEKESMYMAISSKLAPNLPEKITNPEFEEYLKKYPLLLPDILDQYSVENFSNDFVENLNISSTNIKVVPSGTPLSLPIQVTTELGISICNKTNLFSIDPDVKVAEIIDSPYYIKGVFYKKQMENPYLRKLINLIKEEQEKTVSDE